MNTRGNTTRKQRNTAKQSTELTLSLTHTGSLPGVTLVSLLVRCCTMNRAWTAFKAHPYISNVLGYTTLFASADLIQQRVLGKKPAAEGSSSIDWHQTVRVATVGFCFHANFNYHWLRWLERMLPGGGVKVVARKVVLDQLVGAPLTISAFYIGEHNSKLSEDTVYLRFILDHIKLIE